MNQTLAWTCLRNANRRFARRSHLTILAVSVHVFLLLASAALAQIGSVYTPISPKQFVTDANVAVGELSRMLPNGDVKKETKYLGSFRWKTTHTLSLFAVTQQGLSSRYWDTETRSWTDWDHLGNPSNVPLQRVPNSGDSPGIDFGLPLVSGWGVYQPDWIAYQGLALPSANFLPDFETAVMKVDAPAGSLAYSTESANFATVTGPAMPSGWNYFNPQSGFDSTPPGSSGSQRHVFGTGMPRNVVSGSRFRALPEQPLIELRQGPNGGSSIFVDHGRPGDAIAVSVGPGSTTSVIHDYLNVEDPLDHEEQHYVFVATDPVEDGDLGLQGSEVHFLLGDGSQFSWHSLGEPGGSGSRLVGAPVATTYYTKTPILGGKGRVIVFAVTESRNGYELAMRYHDGNGWDANWTRYGGPPGLGGGKFKMTSAVVWYDGNSNDLANLRISAFGYSEENGSLTGGLVEWHWSGGSWGWKPMRFAPNGHGLRTDHATVVDEGTRDRLVVFARTYDGRIYEDVQQFENGRLTFFGWNDLSTEPLLVSRFGSFGLLP